MRTCITIPRNKMPAFMAHEVVKLRFEVRPQPEWIVRDYQELSSWEWDCPYKISLACDRCFSDEQMASRLKYYRPYSPGQVLVVREDWSMECGGVIFRAEYESTDCAYSIAGVRFRSASTMPVKFSRSKARVLTIDVEHGQTWDYVIELVKEE